MELRGFFGDIMRAIGFLSRFPVPSRFFSGEPVPASALSGAFPAAGVLILLPAAALLWLLLALGADPLLAALMALSVQIACCGALHEDGLADAIDGLFGGRSRERALEIMKDSRVGSYGVIAMCLSIAIRAAAIAAIARLLPALDAAACLLAAAAVSRALMVWHWASLPPARADGVAAAAGMPRPAAMHAALMIGLLLAIALLVFTVPVFALVVALVAAAAGVAVFTGLVRGKIGGHTGDTIGACQQLAEIAVLIGLALAA